MSLAELRERKAQREDARAKEREALEEEALTLEEAWEAKGKRHGIDFEVVTTEVGNFVVTKPDFVVAKKFSDKDEKTSEDVFQFAAPCVVFPDQGMARAIFQEHGGIPWVLTVSLMRMYEGGARAFGKK